MTHQSCKSSLPVCNRQTCLCSALKTVCLLPFSVFHHLGAAEALRNHRQEYPCHSCRAHLIGALKIAKNQRIFMAWLEKIAQFGTGFRIILALPPGVEPGFAASETAALSIELWEPSKDAVSTVAGEGQREKSGICNDSASDATSWQLRLKRRSPSSSTSKHPGYPGADLPGVTMTTYHPIGANR